MSKAQNEKVPLQQLWRTVLSNYLTSPRSRTRRKKEREREREKSENEKSKANVQNPIVAEHGDREAQ